MLFKPTFVIFVENIMADIFWDSFSWISHESKTSLNMQFGGDIQKASYDNLTIALVRWVT
jgi:hypothetical protein